MQAWLADTAESFALMGAFLSIVHPVLYRTGRDVFMKIISDPSVVKEGDAVLEILKLWTSPFQDMGSSAIALHHYTETITRKGPGLIFL